MQQVGIFTPRTAIDINYKPVAMDQIENLLFTGDDRGNLYRHQVQPDAMEIIQQDLIMKKSLTNKSIDQIRFLPYEKQKLLVLSDQQVFCIDASAGIKQELISTGKIKLFTLNMFSKAYQYEVAALTRKMEVEFLTYNPSQHRFEKQRERIVLPDPISCMAFVGSQLFLGFGKKNLQVINMDDKNAQATQFNYKMATEPWIIATDSDELFVVQENQTGVFIGRDGVAKEKQPISILKSTILSISIFKTYLLILYDKICQVFTLSDATQISEIPNNKYKSISNSCVKYVFYATENEIICMRPTPPENQIKELLSKNRVEDAMRVFNFQIAPFDTSGSTTKREQLNLDCGWSLIRALDFQKVMPYLKKTNFDIRDIIFLYPQYVIPGHSNDNLSKIPFVQYIAAYVQESGNIKDKNEQAKKAIELQFKSRDFLVKVLENRRTVYMNLKDKGSVILQSSTLCLNSYNFLPSSLDELLEMVDYALINVYCDQNQYDSLNQLFMTSSTTIHCAQFYKQLRERVNKIPKEQFSIMPRFEETFGQIDDSLQFWRIFADSANQKIQLEACHEIIRILKVHPQKNRIQKHLATVLHRQMPSSYPLFESLPEGIITPPVMIKYFDEQDSLPLAQKKELKEKYLEIIIEVRNNEDEVLHTQLAKSYLDTIFSIYPPDTPFESLDFTFKNIGPIYSKLRNFVMNPKSKFNSSALLDYHVKNSWMIPQIVALLGRDKLHEEALSKLIDCQQYKWAEQYCCEQNDMLLNKLFRKYIELYQSLQDEVPRKEDLIHIVFETINNFLKKYSTHSQLNSLDILEFMLDSWVLSVEGEDDGLFQFLDSSISHNIHLRRAKQAGKHLAEKDALNIECKLAELNKGHIKITQNTICGVCQKSIGDRVFVVYPNAVCAHNTCIKNHQVCPKTDRDFFKYFKF